MKALIFSDSHRSFAPMVRAYDAQSPVDWIIHAGDVHNDVEDLQIMYPRTPVAFVRGNNDYFLRDIPDERFFTLEGVKIFLTHGHLYGAKASHAALYKKAASVGADICIFGHTHRACCEKIGNVTLFNPGTATRSYGVLEIHDGKFNLEICEI